MVDSGLGLYFVGLIGGVILVGVTVAAMWVKGRRV